MKIEQVVRDAIDQAVKELGLSEVEFVIEHPEDMDHGDFACNVALVAGGGKDLANKIVARLSESDLKKIASKTSVAGPGFINISIRREVIGKQIDKLLRGGVRAKVEWGSKVMVEYAHPNTHKQFHIGHLRNISLGMSICRLLEMVGVKVVRANYQGDVGLHIAKAVWGIQSMDKDYKIAQKASVFDKVKFLGQAYAAGAQAYEKDEKAKEKIISFNKQIFEGRGEIIELWRETRAWSLEYFDKVYQRVGTKYDRLYFESECTDGVKIAKKALEKGILTKSQGAVVFDGTKHGLDTRVFINSAGLPTYEAKELSLAPKQFEEYPDIDKIIHVVGPEQKSFFEVTFKVEELLDPKTFKGKQYHRVYEFVDLKGGKMSSRKGKVVTGWWLLDEAKRRIKKAYKVDDELAEMIAVGAVKYAFLKVRPSSKIAFDMNESVSLEGNSGPYLQYTYARCQSVLEKAGVQKGSALKLHLKNGPAADAEEEDELLRSLYRFGEVVVEAAEELSPNLVCNFLYDVAQKYNSFYNKHSILKAKTKEQKQTRLWLTKATGEILKQGLEVLGIKAPKKM